MTTINTRYGEFNIIGEDATISRSLQLYGEWAQNEISLLAEFIQPGSMVVDAGAFIGTHARAFSMLVGPSGRVLAFEPRQAIVNILAENAKLSPVDNISVIGSALGEKSDTLIIPALDTHVKENMGALSLVSLNNQDELGEEVSITTLDACSLDRLDFLKIDVEGMELEVLNGAKQTVERFRPVIFAECNSLEANSPIIEWSRDENYKIYGVLSLAFNPQNYARNTLNIFGPSQEAGLLLVPRDRYSQYEQILLRSNLPQIKNIDDLALLLLHKPQYPYEVLAHTAVAANLMMSYPSPLSSKLNEALAEREKEIGGLNQAIAMRDGEIAKLSEGLAERDKRIASLNREASERDDQLAKLVTDVSERDRQISAYHNTVVGRDEHIYSLNQAVVERDRIIQNIYHSHSWRLTKPIRGISRAFKRVARLGLKLKPSNIRLLYTLAKPHLRVVIRNPRMIRSKFNLFWAACKSDGYKGVIQRLQQSSALKGIAYCMPPDKSVAEVMRQLASPPTEPDWGELDCIKNISIIIPVYRGEKETKRCIDSVIDSANRTPHEVIIINDCSPEPEINALLNSYKGKYSHVRVVENNTNLGFVKSVNHGMRLAGNADIVLLNSDTEVANNWLDRLAYHAYIDNSVGTVTPFSNNATICNYPDLDGWALLPNGETVSFLDKACASANAGMSVTIPTAVGFCMYIKRSCLDDVGLFDDKSFGKGYGEENDFCLKASRKGWRHILATDIFVYHEGEISFSESASSKKNQAIKIIRDRYPNYENEINSHVIENSVYPYRVAVTAARYRLDDRPVILLITHHLGGGTEKHVQELAHALSANNVRVLFLRPFNNGNGCDVSLEAYDQSDKLKINLSSHTIELLARVIKVFGISKVHVHHTIGFNFSIEKLLKLISAPYDVTIHDYYSICPRINLVRPTKGYCGDPTVDECNACLGMEPRIHSDIEIVWWRAGFSSLLNGASRVYCPSEDTASRISKHFPGASVKVVPHENIELPPLRCASSPRKYRRFAIMGVLADHKGLGLIEEVLTIIEKGNLPIEFALIGYPERALPASRHLIQTGPYKDSELPELIEKIDPDAFLFPAQCPETYSYTLSVAILTGRPLVVSRLGALPERIKDISNATIFPYDLSGEELVEFLLSIQLRGAVPVRRDGEAVVHA